MVFMTRRDEGYPVAALLLLGSMFAFALVFHAVTKPSRRLPARFDVQLTALLMPALAELPSLVAQFPPTSAPWRKPIPATVVEPTVPARVAETTVSVATTAPLLESVAPREPAGLRATIFPVTPGEPAAQLGAVTRALAGTGSALRSAFRKAF